MKIEYLLKMLDSVAFLEELGAASGTFTIDTMDGEVVIFGITRQAALKELELMHQERPWFVPTLTTLYVHDADLYQWNCRFELDFSGETFDLEEAIYLLQTVKEHYRCDVCGEPLVRTGNPNGATYCPNCTEAQNDSDSYFWGED